MRMVVAVVVCAVEFVAFAAMMGALGLTGGEPKPGGSQLPQIMAIAVGMMIVGLTWSAITGRGVPKWLDPLGFMRFVDEPVASTPTPAQDAGAARPTGSA